MKTKRSSLFLLALIALAPTSALAYDGLDLYSARISAKDRFNSQGTALDSVRSILAQDRANYHRFRNRDPQDAKDFVFKSTEGRALFQKARIEISPSLSKRIRSGTAVDITVYVYTKNHIEVRPGLLKFIP